MSRPPVSPLARTTPAAVLAISTIGALLLAAPAAAWDSKGHNVVEALAYRTLVEGHGGQPPRPDVLRDLINDGALATPHCFGRGEAQPHDCVEAARTNPLLCWPQPQTDRPDAAFRRQFSDPGQCFHFMATLADAESEPLPGRTVPRGLATTAFVRCRDLLDNLLRQIVVDGGPGTRRSGYGLYELAHAVADSFSGAHTERRVEDQDVDFLRVWKPVEKLARLPLERSARIPPEAYHLWNDRRDKAYVGTPECEKRADQPYDVPFECLSEDGDRSRQALVELYLLVHDLRMAQLSSPAKGAEPERSEAWTSYKEKWFTPVTPCRGEECEARQPSEPAAGGYTLFGIGAERNWTSSSTDVTASVRLLRASEDLNPFIYALDAQVGYRRLDGGDGVGVVGLQLNLLLPLGKRAFLGLTPAAWRTTFGGAASGGPELLMRLFEFDLRIGDRTWLVVNAPLQVNWTKSRAEWILGASLAMALGSAGVAGGPVIAHHSDEVERHDDAWVPPPAPFGRLGGRAASLFVVSGATIADAPEVSVEGRRYGLGSLGAELKWARDRWGGRYAWVPAASLSVGVRATSGEVSYLTGALGVSLQWFPRAIQILGLSLTPVRVEGGPKIAGRTDTDPSPDVHGTGRDQYYLQAGSRLGIVFNAGIVDILVEGPTLAWRSNPFNAGEVLSLRLGIRLN